MRIFTLCLDPLKNARIENNNYMKKNLSKLIVFDGNAIIHRSFHALPTTLTTKDGTVVNAVYGFANFLMKAISEFKPDYIALTFDKKAPTFRHVEYEAYKATRVKGPDELYEQLPIAKKLAESFGLPVFELDGFEADDLIGTITNKISQEYEGVESVIITGDLDTLQLINDKVKVYTMSRGLSDSVLYDTEQVIKRYGFGPEKMVDYKALRGDVSDNIPGVKGIGEKTAAELIINFESLDGIYRALEQKDQRIKPRIAEILKTGKESAQMSRRLSEIDCHAPIKFNLEDLSFKKIDKGAVMEMFSSLEFKSLAGRLSGLDDYLDGEEKNNLGQNRTAEGSEDKFARNEKKFQYQIISDAEGFSKFLKKLSDQKEFSIDTETTSLDPLQAKLLGISISWKEGEAYFIDIKNTFSGKGQHPWLEALKPILTDKNIKKTGHNIKYDFRVLKNQGLPMEGLNFDTMIASYLLNPANRQHNLDALSFSEFGWEKISSAELTAGQKKVKDFSIVDPKKLGIYACEDADFTERLHKILAPRLKAEKLDELFNDIEMPLVEVLSEMEDNGIMVDKDKLAEIGSELKKKIKTLEKKIYEEADSEFNINSTKQLKEILFEKLAIESRGIKKTKTGLSTAADELEKMKDLHPIIPLIQDYRELSKLLNTYVDALPELVDAQGRIHTSFNQGVTATGRLSSTDPNLQNIPARNDWGTRIRSAFVARPGWKLISLDYSQIELRLAAHLSGDQKMIAAFQEGVDIHSTTAAGINEIELKDVTSQMRREAKATNFGILYGQGSHGLSQNAGISYARAKEFIAKYFDVYKDVKKFIESTIESAREKGYVTTMFGRKRQLPEINSSIIMVRKGAERMAVNTPLQGSAADIIKIAMIRVFERYRNCSDIKMLLQVHDELIFEAVPDKADTYAKEIKKIMEEVVELKVPIIVDASIGDNWGQLEDMDD